MMTTTPGVLTLTIPAAPEHVRFARLLAGGVASQCNFDVDAVEDVRIAVDECCHVLMGAAAGAGTITLTCSGSDDEIRIEGWADATLSAAVTPEFEELSRSILDSVTDDYELMTRAGLNGFVITKRQPRG